MTTGVPRKVALLQCRPSITAVSQKNHAGPLSAVNHKIYYGSVTCKQNHQSEQAVPPVKVTGAPVQKHSQHDSTKDALSAAAAHCLMMKGVAMKVHVM